MQSRCLTDYKQCETSQGCYPAPLSMVNIVMLHFLSLFLAALFSTQCLASSLRLTHCLSRESRSSSLFCLHISSSLTATNFRRVAAGSSDGDRLNLNHIGSAVLDLNHGPVGKKNKNISKPYNAAHSL